MAKYLVTGGCGFIGSHLGDRLVGAGHELVVLDDLSTGLTENLSRGAQFIQGDIRDPHAVKHAMKNVEGCFHLAAIASVDRSNRDWVGTHQTNLTGTINVFNEAKTANHGKPVPVVYASSAAVYGDNQNVPLNEKLEPQPLTAYGADKLACELHGRIATLVHHVPTTGLRFFNVFGPRQDPKSPYSGVISIFFDKINQAKTIDIHGDGEQTRDFIYVDDVVSFLIQSMNQKTKNAEIYNVCSGRVTSINQLADEIARVLKKELQKKHVPARVGDIARSLGDPSLAKHDFGIDAGTLLDQGLKRMYEATR